MCPGLPPKEGGGGGINKICIRDRPRPKSCPKVLCVHVVVVYYVVCGGGRDAEAGTRGQKEKHLNVLCSLAIYFFTTVTESC